MRTHSAFGDQPLKVFCRRAMYVQLHMHLSRVVHAFWHATAHVSLLSPTEKSPADPSRSLIQPFLTPPPNPSSEPSPS